MTGFGKGEATLQNKKITVEIRSLNSKQMDLSLRLPAVYRQSENELRNVITRTLQRGKVDVFVSVESQTVETPARINREVFREYLRQMNDTLAFAFTYPNSYNQIVFGTVKEAWNMGAVAVGATIYFGSEQSRRQLVEIADAFEYAHELGMATVLWCYLRNSSFKKDGIDYSAAADLTGQANHLGVTIKADIIKQKLPENNGGFTAINFGKIDQKMYTELTTEHPIDLCRYQVANNYMGRVGLINSGGESHGASDLKDAVVTAVINKRAGGMGLISGRKAFQRPMKDGVELLHSIQDIYLDKDITIA